MQIILHYMHNEGMPASPFQAYLQAATPSFKNSNKLSPLLASSDYYLKEQLLLCTLPLALPCLRRQGPPHTLGLGSIGLMAPFWALPLPSLHEMGVSSPLSWPCLWQLQVPPGGGLLVSSCIKIMPASSIKMVSAINIRIYCATRTVQEEPHSSLFRPCGTGERMLSDPCWGPCLFSF